MSVALAAIAAAGVFLIVAGKSPVPFTERVGVYLRPPRPTTDSPSPPPDLRLRQAGLDWTKGRLASRRLLALTSGAFVGMLLAQGDLFVTGSGRSMAGLALLGGLGGLLGLNVWITNRRDRRIERMKHELPTIADALALHVMAGESIATAIETLVGSAHGVAVDELRLVTESHLEGLGLPEALNAAARDTVDPEAARLYTLLGTAHRTGGRLAASLSELATDYRAALARELTAEGGRKAIATYGPILALMIPVALLFLMYPTLVGLQDLSAGP